MTTKIAIVGCGFVADLYVGTLRLHPELEVVGVADRDLVRAKAFGAYHSFPVYRDLEELLSDNRSQVILNLTSPESHYEVTHAALVAGKHVYSEKPLAMRLDQAIDLCELAKKKGLLLSGAPCSVLGQSAQTLWSALRLKAIGAVRVVYAEMDDGMLHKMPYEKWRSASGVPWPYRTEFEVGCTLEHAGYAVTWLTAFFGPARSVTAFRSCQVPEKRADEAIRSAPDFSVACIEFGDGVVARLTCSIVAPRDHCIRLIGDSGVLSVQDTWFNSEPVYLRRWLNIGRRTVLSPFKKRFRTAKSPQRKVRRRGAAQMDYLLGVQELCDALREHRPPRLSADFCLHTTDIVLAINGAHDTTAYYVPQTTFAAMQPMPWSVA